MEEDKLLKLSICESTQKQLHWFAELVWLSSLKIDSSSKGCGQDCLKGEVAIHTVYGKRKCKINKSLTATLIHLMHYEIIPKVCWVGITVHLLYKEVIHTNLP